MIEGSLFIGLIIAAITQLIKMASPNVQGWLTIIVAFLVGIAIALIDVLIGVEDLTIAQGIMGALTAIGYASLAKKASGDY